MIHLSPPEHQHLFNQDGDQLDHKVSHKLLQIIQSMIHLSQPVLPLQLLQDSELSSEDGHLVPLLFNLKLLQIIQSSTHLLLLVQLFQRFQGLDQPTMVQIDQLLKDKLHELLRLMVLSPSMLLDSDE